MVREDLNINLDEYIKQIERNFPSLSHQECRELIEELYDFLEEFYFLQIEKDNI